jgi:spermidine synthase
MTPATISEFEGVRYLHLGTVWVQGAMRVRKPHAIELEYVQRMMVWMLLVSEPQRAHAHAVQLGLGAASITRFTHRVLRMKTTAVELNPTVIDACRLWFHLPFDDKLLSVVQADAGDWVADASRAGSAHVLNVDLYDHEASSPVLDSVDFYAACHRLLDEDGLMTVNLFGHDAHFERSARRIARAFGSPHVWTLPPTRDGNTIVLAGKGVVMPDRATLEMRAESIQSRFGLPARKWVRLIRPLPARDPRTIDA